MKLIVVPGFLGFAEETHHIDLIERAKLIGIEGSVVESEELSNRHIDKYRLSKHIETVNQLLDKQGDEDVALVGVSLGGVVASVACHGRKNIVKLACIVSPYRFATGDDMESRLDEWKFRGSYLFRSSRYGDVDVPYEFVSDAQQFDARNFMSEVKCPKLFLAGSRDIRVPSELTSLLAAAASQPKIYRLIDGMPHDYKNQPVFTKLVNDFILEFLVS